MSVLPQMGDKSVVNVARASSVVRLNRIGSRRDRGRREIRAMAIPVSMPSISISAKVCGFRGDLLSITVRMVTSSSSRINPHRVHSA